MLNRMSSESVAEELVGTHMRMSLTKQIEGMDRENSNDRRDHDGGEENLTLAQLSNTPRTPSPSPSPAGKRKKRPKQMRDELFYQFKTKKKKKNKKPLVSKSEHAGSDYVGKSKSCKREKTADQGPKSAVQVKTPAMIRAVHAQASLGSEFPSFTKPLVRSHVSSCFWMGLPMAFCKVHLPRNDTNVILENENGEQFELKFIAEKTGLSAGWRKFVAGHKLLEGDVLIFQLVEPNKFKVSIIRANDLAYVDGARSLLKLEAHSKQNDTENGEATPKNKKRKWPKSLPLAVVQKNEKAGLPKSVPKALQSVEQFENDRENVGSEVLLDPRFSGPAVRFRDIKSFTDFNILVDGRCIDSELPEHTRAKYYELCCSKNALIHACLLRCLNYRLVAGIICETVEIAHAIRACTLTTSQDEYTNWDKTLKSFELLGMNVGFLRARLRRLISLAFDSKDALETRKYIEAKTERVRAEDDIRNLVAKIVELKEAYEKFDADIEALKSKAESYELRFMEEVDAPW